MLRHAAGVTAAILKEQQDAVEKKKQDELRKEKEAADAAVEKKKKDDLKKEEKRLRKEQKKAEKVEKAAKATESRKGKGATEAALVNKEKGTDVDTKGEMLEGVKKKALKNVVEESDGESRPGPRKRVKMEILGLMEGEEEMIGNKRCMRCHQDSAHCFACLASEKSNHGHTYSHCKSKKAACSFNKGTSSALAIGSKEIMELLEKLANTVETLPNKVDILMGQVISLGGHMDDLVDDFRLC
ncbi:hypothetical protein EV421DRAFT_1939362 [Armillaria borealis]|uniref:Uncharacterized protein n=1 Tax=Armillaria borealis TaxID=47425 RepID=A0AA39IUW8_9AGAR|nr:hypothetical protein EV421DRAFT_1939362 [Armillaria borealis]